MSLKIRYPVAIAALLATQAFAPAFGALDDQSFNYETAKDLIAVCSSDAEAAAFGCRAFLEATVQYHDAVSDRKKMKPLICPPQGTTVIQAREVFLAWGQKNAKNAVYMKDLPVVAVVRLVTEVGVGLDEPEPRQHGGPVEPGGEGGPVVVVLGQAAQGDGRVGN
jgi:hypothetical protein